MTIGDLVRVHWGNADWSGIEGVEWGYGVGVVAGEIVWWENARILASPCGDIEILFRGERVNYNLGRLEVISESR